MDEPDGNYSQILPLRAVLALKVSGPLVILNVEAVGKVPKQIFGRDSEKSDP
jgi:hypothetical protein